VDLAEVEMTERRKGAVEAINNVGGKDEAS
jgi:hypothetical protein